MPRGGRRGYEEPPYYHMTPEMMREHDPEYWRDLDRKEKRMYFSEPVMRGNTGLSDRTENTSMRDHREGKSGQMRRSYMETKETHSDNSPESKRIKMSDLEKYAKELSEDITEMIEGASPEEKNMLRTKIQTLAQKIQ